MRKRNKIRIIFLHPFQAKRILLMKIRQDQHSRYSSNLFQDYLVLSAPEPKTKTQSSVPKKIIWIVPPIGKGGGGATTISRFINYFQELGLPQEIQIYSEHIVDLNSQKSVWKYLGVSSNINVGLYNLIQSPDIIIATAWQTYVPSIRISLRDRRILFLQDDERSFEATGDVTNIINLALNQYDFVITAGSWLKKTLTGRNQVAIDFNFGADQIYFPPIRHRKRHLVVYHQPDKPRRMGNLISAFLLEFHKKYPQWKITVVGSTLRDPNLGFADQLGILEPIRLAELYRNGSLGLVLSATNASLIPFEMLASGMPVITNSGPNSEWLGKISGLFYSIPTVEALLKTFESDLYGKTVEIGKIPNWESQLDLFWQKFKTEMPKGKIANFFSRKSD